MGVRWAPTRGRPNTDDRRFDPPAVPTIADGVDGGRMTERQILVDEVLRDEGLRLKPYTDSVGVLTIGVGRNLTGNGISTTEAMMLLNNDLDEAITDLSTFVWFADLDTVRQRVLVNMRFQLGAAGFRRFKATLAAVAAGDYVIAGDRMRASLWARQVPNRANRLIRLMKTGVADV